MKSKTELIHHMATLERLRGELGRVERGVDDWVICADKAARNKMTTSLLLLKARGVAQELMSELLKSSTEASELRLLTGSSLANPDSQDIH